MIQIGSYSLSGQVLLAPMAGISDQPMRELCFAFGAALCVSEMLSSKPALWQSEKSVNRRPRTSDSGLRIVQLVGTEPQQLASSAQYYVEQGAQIIDINMGCPAKKVCRKAAGSALLREPALVADICRAVVNAVDVPVTLKIRTGWCPQTRNAVDIAHIAEDCGIQSLVIHGRTRACRFRGQAEYDTIAAVKQALRIPVIANGDIDSPQKAQQVMATTGVDGVMIGRAAHGNPWLFTAINHYLEHGKQLAPPALTTVIAVMQRHIRACHQHYGEQLGTKIARKHAAAYFQCWFAACVQLRQAFNSIDMASEQLSFLNQLAAQNHSLQPLPRQGLAA